MLEFILEHIRQFLKQNKLVKNRREGKSIFYSLNKTRSHVPQKQKAHGFPPAISEFRPWTFTTQN